MSRLLCYIPSYNDSHWVAESVQSSPDWEIVISDNASSEPHASALAALAGPRVHLMRQAESLGRVGNWKFCVEHFLASGATWMKYLCAGDRHKPNSQSIFLRAMERHPQVRCIVPRMENIWPHRRMLWEPTDAEVVLSSEHLLAATIQYGNIFHGLSGPLIHVDAVREGFAFGEETLSYCADLLFMVGISRRGSAAYLTEVTAEFVAERRKGMQAGIYTLEHYLEEGLVRLRAADALLELTGDRERYNRVLSHVVAWVRECLTRPLEKLTGEMRYPPEVITGDVLPTAVPLVPNRPGGSR